MKSLQELYDEIMASDELKKQFVSLKPEQVEDFVKSQGCDATLEEFSRSKAERGQRAFT